MSQFETLEEDLAREIAISARRLSLEALGEIVPIGDNGEAVTVPQWAHRASQEAIARIIAANGGSLARAIWGIASGAEPWREFAVPPVDLPSGDARHIVDTTEPVHSRYPQSIPESFGHWLRGWGDNVEIGTTY